MQDKLQGAKLVRLTRKSILVVAVAVIIAAVILFVIAHEHSRRDSQREAANAATPSTDVTSPYDLAEVTGKLNLDILENAAFVSILIPNAEGKLTSYMTDASSAAAEALIQAVRDASKIKSPPSPAESSSTLTFVLPSRQIVTFTLDLPAGLLYRQGQAWRPEGDLEALVNAATIAPQ